MASALKLPLLRRRLGGSTPLKTLIRYNPSLLIVPQWGAGWQGTSGGTLAASGQPLGLGADLAALGGKTLSEWLATAPELVPAGQFNGSTGWTLASGMTVSGGAITIATAGYSEARFDAAAIAGAANRVFTISLTVSGYTSGVLSVAIDNGAAATLSSGNGDKTAVVVTGASGLGRVVFITGAAGLVVSNVSIKAIPGNHLRAGTWASPSDAARGTFQNGAISFDGVDDYYSLLNPISITESMTVVRAFKRASAGINSVGIGAAASDAPVDGRWGIGNFNAVGLGAAGTDSSSTSTATGSFVFTARRTASVQSLRRNGADVALASATPPTVSGSFDAVGRRNANYNSGEISFLAVFPTELTGANLALVEQIAASTNGATLA